MRLRQNVPAGSKMTPNREIAWHPERIEIILTGEIAENLR